jgi:hypothetical protein
LPNESSLEAIRLFRIDAQGNLANNASAEVSGHTSSHLCFALVGNKDRDDAGFSAPVNLDRRPSPPHPDVIDDYGIPILCQLEPERATERCDVVLSRNIREVAEQAPHRRASADFSTALRGYDDPFDPVGIGALGAIADTTHCQNCQSHASAAKAPHEMDAVRQISRVNRHRIHPGEPKTPQSPALDIFSACWMPRARQRHRLRQIMSHHEGG